LEAEKKVDKELLEKLRVAERIDLLEEYGFIITRGKDLIIPIDAVKLLSHMFDRATILVATTALKTRVKPISNIDTDSVIALNAFIMAPSLYSLKYGTDKIPIYHLFKLADAIAMLIKILYSKYTDTLIITSIVAAIKLYSMVNDILEEVGAREIPEEEKKEIEKTLRYLEKALKEEEQKLLGGNKQP